LGAVAVLGVTGMEGLMLGKLTFTIPTRIKKRVLFVALVFLAVWPILHHGIVTTYDMDPWLYFGLSMYASTEHCTTRNLSWKRCSTHDDEHGQD